MMKPSSKKSPRNSSEPDVYQIPAHSNCVPGSYPAPAYLNFVPGGIDYDNDNDSISSSSFKQRNWYTLNLIAPDTLVTKAKAADEILRTYSIRYNDASIADSVKIPHRLPSLSILAEAAFGPLTGVHATSVRAWADAMALAYLDKSEQNGIFTKKKEEEQKEEQRVAMSEKELLDQFYQLTNNAPPLSPSNKPSNATATNSSNHHQTNANDLVTILKNMHKRQIEQSTSMENNPLSPLPVRPCGYVFKRNDIAWNCRTCQTDSTCVLCDTCFHASDHEGHEVYFHRTSPGGCCDCGDAEAWRVEGCCPAHRPRKFVIPNSSNSNGDVMNANNGEDVEMTQTFDHVQCTPCPSSNSTHNQSDENLDFEAVKASLRGRADGDITIQETLPPKFAAALGVVIGAAVQTTVQAVDGAAIGADPVQWTRRWADQIRKIQDGRCFDEEYSMSGNSSTTNTTTSAAAKSPTKTSVKGTSSSCANSMSEAMKLEMPNNRVKYHLRLHNDDVHTYDEVIDSLYRRSPTYGNFNQNRNLSETDTDNGILNTITLAKDMTTHVDTDGQVVVRAYTTLEGAKAGYDRLKTYGLHCAVVTTPQIDLELRARVLLSWLSDIAAAHPAAASLVVHALLDVTEGSDSLGGVYVWPSSRMIPPWSFTKGYFSSARVSIQEENEKEVSLPGWRRRMDVFPPNLKSSFLTREESRQLHNLGLSAMMEILSPKKG